MSNFGQRQHDGTFENPGPPDGAKTHGDKLAGAVEGAAGNERHPADEAPHPGAAPRTSDSLKLHGDKLSGAMRNATSSGKPNR